MKTEKEKYVEPFGEFSTPAVPKILGIKWGKLRPSLDEGYIYPNTIKSYGTQRKQSIFTTWDIYGIALFQKLVEDGVSRKKAGEYYKLWANLQNNILVSHMLPNAKYFIVIRRANHDDESLIVNLFSSETHLEGRDDVEDVKIFNMQRIMVAVDERIERFNKGE
jgi:hypothetical protein